MGRLLRVTRDEAWDIKGRAVQRGLAQRGQDVVLQIGVDEKAIAKRHRYLAVVADLRGTRVLYLADDRKQESIVGPCHLSFVVLITGVVAAVSEMTFRHLASAMVDEL